MSNIGRLLQTDDNDKYLHTDFYGNESVAGAIFLDFESQSDMLGKHIKAVSCYYAKSNPIARITRFQTEESYAVYVQAMLEPCTFAEIPEEPITALYSLVTCSYEVEDARTMLYAIEVEPVED